jgi:hypothetical protein
VAFKSWWSFVRFQHSVKRVFRYSFSNDSKEFLDELCRTAESHTRVFAQGHVLWRAQQGAATRLRDCAEYEVECEVPLPKARMKPLIHSAHEGRANPKGIPVLYTSTDKLTAMAEVRDGLRNTSPDGRDA